MGDVLEREIDLTVLLAGIRRRWLPIVLSALVVALAVWLWSRSQSAVFEATSSVIATGAAADGVVSRTLITAPPLPDGAVDEALRSPVVLDRVIARLRTNPALPADARTRLADRLGGELQKGKLKSLTVSSRLDGQQNGIYTLTGRAGSPLLAKTLVDTSVQALLAWDSNRALQGILKAQASLRSQVEAIDAQLANSELPALERQSLSTTRATTLQNLGQVTIVEQAATGTLSLVSAAVTPLDPVAPKPLRNAVLAGVLTLLLGTAVAALAVVMDRTVRNEEDLLELGVPTLGVIPRLRRRDILMSGMVRAARQSGLMEAVGFLRINVLSALHGRPHGRLMVTSTAPGEGKSSLTAALADGFAASGQQVLIIDADLRRGSQMEIWSKHDRSGGEWQQLVGVGGGRTLQQALRDPDNVQVLEVQPGLHLLPAGPGLHDSLGLLTRPDLDALLDRWSVRYDVVLIDSAPLLAVADGLLLAPHTNGVLMVAESGRTSLQSVRRALRRAERAGATVMGMVINKADVRQGDSYSYDYRPRAGAQARL